MDLNWFTGILFGIVSGVTEIFPVSSPAHRILMLKLFGMSSEPELLQFMIDLGITGALYYGCQNHIIRIIRAKRLSRVPKRHRKRPLDTASLNDLSLLKTMLIPVILSFFLYEKAQTLGGSMLLIAIFMLINGVILYLPQFFPGANRDSRTMSRVQGLLIGLGGSLSVIPGISGIGGAFSVGAVCGVDKGYGLNMVLLLDMFVCAGLVLFDVLALAAVGLGGIGFGTVFVYLLAGIAAFIATTLTIKLLRGIISEISFTVFGLYCWGVALFTFIMNLLA